MNPEIREKEYDDGKSFSFKIYDNWKKFHDEKIMLNCYNGVLFFFQNWHFTHPIMVSNENKVHWEVFETLYWNF